MILSKRYFPVHRYAAGLDEDNFERKSSCMADFLEIYIWAVSRQPSLRLMRHKGSSDIV